MTMAVTIFAAFTLGLLTCVGLLMPRCAFRVRAGHLGVLTNFGKAVLASERDTAASASAKHSLMCRQPGFHWKWPWQKVIEVSVMERVLDLSGKEGGTVAMAADGTLLRLDSKLRYAPIPKDLYEYLFALRNPIEHIKGLFACLLRNEIANFKGRGETSPTLMKMAGDEAADALHTTSYAVIRSERHLLNQRLQDFCHEQMDGRYGVEFIAVDLTDILPPDELADALNAVFNARTEAEARFTRAESECWQKVIAAERGVDIACANAVATEREIGKAAEFLVELQQADTLRDYLGRRRSEVFADSRAVFVRRNV